MVMDRQMSAEGHTFRIGIELAVSGWNVCQEVDARVVRVDHYDDWHRAERAVQRLEWEVSCGVATKLVEG